MVSLLMAAEEAAGIPAEEAVGTVADEAVGITAGLEVQLVSGSVAVGVTLDIKLETALLGKAG